jgi:hypothetical protein
MEEAVAALLTHASHEEAAQSLAGILRAPYERPESGRRIATDIR